MNNRTPNLVLFSAFGALLLGPIPSLPADETQSGGYVCSRHGHGDKGACDFDLKFNDNDAARYTADFKIWGHRHGGSQIRGSICLKANNAWYPSFQCSFFGGTGDQLGPEQGSTHND